MIVAVAAFATIKAKSLENGIAKFDSISFALTNATGTLSDEEVAERQNKALEELNPLLSKGGVVGLRSNMLAADIKFAQKNYEEARSLWLKAAQLNKKAYTSSLCYFNAAVCSENLGDNENALSYYKTSSENEDFLLIDHALFSLGRVSETLGKYEDAKDAYEKLFSLRPASNWGKLAKTRSIALKAQGNIQ